MTQQQNIENIIAEVADSEKEQSQSQSHKKDENNSFIEQDTFIKGQSEVLKESVEDLRNYRELRNKYAGRVFWFMCCWSILVFGLLITKGFLAGYFALSDTVLTILVGGTTVSVVGLVGFMMQGLFHSSNSNKQNDTKK